MVQQLLSLFPADQLGTIVTSIVLTGAVIGAATLLLGGLRSRFSITLLLLVVGAVVGRCIPAWLSLAIEPNATAMVGAMVLGILGFVFHRFWVAVWLGVVAASLAAAILWFRLGADRTFDAPSLEAGMTVSGYLGLCWHQMPHLFKADLPFVCIPLFLAGLVVGLLLEQVAVALLYALIGTSLLFSSLMFGEASEQMPSASYLLPRLGEMRIVLFAGFVLLGTLVQLVMMRKHQASTQSSEKPEDDS